MYVYVCVRACKKMAAGFDGGAGRFSFVGRLLW